MGWDNLAGQNELFFWNREYLKGAAGIPGCIALPLNRIHEVTGLPGEEEREEAGIKRTCGSAEEGQFDAFETVID